jgi:uncharacterized membrane protein YhaH (DUF805 family)
MEASMSELLFSPKGRTGRGTFAAVFFTGLLLCAILYLFLEFGLAYRGTFIVLFCLSVLLPVLWRMFCVSSKRLHDIGKPAWWSALLLLPPLTLWPLYEMLFLPSEAQDNGYGPASGGSEQSKTTFAPPANQGQRTQFGRRT